MTVKIPVKIRARLAMVPWMSLVSIALDVPTAWADVPRARPIEISLSSLNTFTRIGDRADPKIPVTITTQIVIIGMPPMFADTSCAIAVVTDFGTRLAMMFESRLSRSDKAPILIAWAITPVMIEMMITFLCFRSCSLCLYKGMASETVAGAMSRVTKSPPTLKDS